MFDFWGTQPIHSMPHTCFPTVSAAVPPWPVPVSLRVQKTAKGRPNAQPSPPSPTVRLTSPHAPLIAVDLGGLAGDETQTSFLEGADPLLSPGGPGGSTRGSCGAPKGIPGFHSDVEREPFFLQLLRVTSPCRDGGSSHPLVPGHEPRMPGGSHNLKFSGSLTIPRTSHLEESLQLRDRDTGCPGESPEGWGEAAPTPTPWVPILFQGPRLCPQGGPWAPHVLSVSAALGSVTEMRPLQ